MLSWPGNSWVYWAASAVALLLLLRFVVYGDRISLKSRGNRLAVAAGAAASVLAVGTVPGVVQAWGRASSDPEWWVDPVFWVSGAIFAAMGLFLGAWALFGDRSRGRKRCPKCWYDMSGAPNLKCPECGHEAKRERRLFRTRRRKLVAALAMAMLLIGMGGGAWPWAKSVNWEKATPDWVILVALPYVPDHAQGGMAEWLWQAALYRIGLSAFTKGGLGNDLRELAAPQWKRRLACWSAGRCMDSGRSSSALDFGLELAVDLRSDAAPLAPRLEALCSGHAEPFVRERAVLCLRNMPSEGARAWQVAMNMLADSTSHCRDAAIRTLATVAERSGTPIDPPRPILNLLSDPESNVRTAAFGSLDSFIPTPDSIRFLEAKVRTLGDGPNSTSLWTSGDSSLREIEAAFSSLIRLQPESPAAKEYALRRVRTSDPETATLLALTLARHAWFDEDVIRAVAERLVLKPQSGLMRDVLRAFAVSIAMTPEQAVDALSVFASYAPLRADSADAFAYLGDRGHSVVPRLQQLAAEWETTDPDAAARLRKSIDVIEGKADPAAVK